MMFIEICMNLIRGNSGHNYLAHRRLTVGYIAQEKKIQDFSGPRYWADCNIFFKGNALACKLKW